MVEDEVSYLQEMRRSTRVIACTPKWWRSPRSCFCLSVLTFSMTVPIYRLLECDLCSSGTRLIERVLDMSCRTGGKAHAVLIHTPLEHYCAQLLVSFLKTFKKILSQIHSDITPSQMNKVIEPMVYEFKLGSLQSMRLCWLEIGESAKLSTSFGPWSCTV